jgi:hypothetical protein
MNAAFRYQIEAIYLMLTRMASTGHRSTRIVAIIPASITILNDVGAKDLRYGVQYQPICDLGT